VTSPQARKGNAAERELAKILTDELGVTVRRKLGAGRLDDEGDLEGLRDTTVEVKNYADTLRAISDGLADLRREQANAATTFGVCFVRRRGGRWLAVMDVDQFCTWYREATG
jgi:Holliday junction resolvase